MWKTARAICAMTVCSSWLLGTGVPSGRCSRWMWSGSTNLMFILPASTMIVSSMLIATVASSSKVVAALSLFGLRKAGTPLEIASTPVSAAQPEEKARASSTTRATLVIWPS